MTTPAASLWQHRREAWIALLAHDLDLAINGSHAIGQLARLISADYLREDAKRLLDDPEIIAIREKFGPVKLADVQDALRRERP